MESGPRARITPERDFQALMSGLFNVLIKRYSDCDAIKLSSILDGTHRTCTIYIEGLTPEANDILDNLPADLTEIIESYERDAGVPTSLRYDYSETRNDAGGDIHIITLSITH